MKSLILLALMAGAGPSKDEQRFDAMTPDSAAAAVTVHELEAATAFDTKQVFQIKSGLLGFVWNDNYIRAFVDKKTGYTFYQIVETVNYEGSAWRFYSQVSYQTSQGMQTFPLTKLEHDTSCTRTCILNETVAFDLSDKLAHAIATLYKPAPLPAAFRYELKADQGTNLVDAV